MSPCASSEQAAAAILERRGLRRAGAARAEPRRLVA
jgi:hypothetical protein